MKKTIQLLIMAMLIASLLVMPATSVFAAGAAAHGDSGASVSAEGQQSNEEAQNSGETSSDRGSAAADETAGQKASNGNGTAGTASGTEKTGSSADENTAAGGKSTAGSASAKKAAGTAAASANQKGGKTAKAAVKTASIDSSTTLADGKYTPKQFTYSGGTGKVTLRCSQIQVRGGNAYAKIAFSSVSYIKLQAGGQTYTPVVDRAAGTSTFTVPVDLNAEESLIGTTTAMSQAHDITYSVKVSYDEPVYDSSTSAVDNSTGIADAVYSPDRFAFSGGSGKVNITCSKVTVSEGRSYAVIVFHSRYYTQLKAAGKLYKGVIDLAGGTSTFQIPVRLNSDNAVIGTTTAMSEAHDITYKIKITLTGSSKVINDENSADSGGSSSDSTKAGKNKKLKDGTYRVRTDTDNRMFYIQPDSHGKKYSILKVKNGKMTATVTLTGQGYDYLCMGTTAKAESLKKSSLSKYKNKNGYYSYKVKVSKLGRKLQIASHSKRLNRWYQHTIIFYSAGAKKVKKGTSAVPSKKNSAAKKKTSGTQTSFKNNRKAERESSWRKDGSGSTSAASSSTTLKDGVYTPSSFSWSGGSGRLAYIRCDKITVTGGRAYAVIVFSSSSYDSLKSGGKVYSKSGSGLSKFVIAVNLNANNTIIGRTTAMSQPHWVKYTIYVGLASAAGKTVSGGANGSVSTGENGAAAATRISTRKMPKKPPTIAGLVYKSEVKVSHAKYFKIYKYEKGIRLIVVDNTRNTYLYKKTKKSSAKKSSAKPAVEYDEEGRVIAKSQHEITEGLYRNNIINYLVVPKGVEVPAGIEKKCIVIDQPADRSYVTSKKVLDFMDEIGAVKNVRDIGVKENGLHIRSIQKKLRNKKIKYAGAYSKPSYSVIVKSRTDLCILPAGALPDKIKKSGKKLSAKDLKKKKAEAEKEKKSLQTIEKRFTALDIPVLTDRSTSEKGKTAEAEWVKVYGAVYGCSKEAGRVYKKEAKKIKKAEKAEKSRKAKNSRKKKSLQN